MQCKNIYQISTVCCRFFRMLLQQKPITLNKNIESSFTKMICSLATLPIFQWLCFDLNEHKWCCSRIHVKKQRKKSLSYFMHCTRAVAAQSQSHSPYKFQCCLRKNRECFEMFNSYFVKNQNRTEKQFLRPTNKKSVKNASSKIKMAFLYWLKNELIGFLVTKIEKFVSFRCVDDDLNWIGWFNSFIYFFDWDSSEQIENERWLWEGEE